MEDVLKQGIVVLTKEELVKLKLPIVGSGGFQSLLKKVAKCITRNKLKIDIELASDIVRYVEQYGQGGFQKRLPDTAIEISRSILLRKQLHEKSIEAYILALETINRLSIKYRVENFLFLICNAWELLMKAKLLSVTPERNQIYYKSNAHSISLDDCLNRLFTNAKDPIRMNIIKVAEIRNDATHLVISDVPKNILGIFQACVLNYHTKLMEWFQTSISDKISIGMMTIVFDFSPDKFDISSPIMKSKIGEETANYLMTFEKEANAEYKTLGYPREYMIDLNYHLAFIKNPKKADVCLSYGADGNPVYAIEVAADPCKTHPLGFKDIRQEISSISGGTVNIIAYDMQCVLANYKWKSGDSFFYKNSMGNRNQYSQDCLDWLSKQFKSNPNFFKDCRESVKSKGLLKNTSANAAL